MLRVSWSTSPEAEGGLDWIGPSSAPPPRARDWEFQRIGLRDRAALEALLRERLDRSRVRLALKRGFDVFASAALLILLFPFLAAVALAIRLESPGPALFMQWRHGRFGRPFRIYKFRTMYDDCCDEEGLLQAVDDDPRVTPIGRRLRRFSIDELPQLWNVLKGDMSLVGPRAHVVGMRACGRPYEELFPGYHLRHLVKPGITGRAQARGLRGPTLEPVPSKMRIVSDLTYISRCSLRLDAQILLRTVLVELRSARET